MGVQDQEVISLWSKEEEEKEENRRRFKNEERTNQATVQVEIVMVRQSPISKQE